ncbi:Asp-tRNA(Asn)/Glu-tRNA(Gln) amidotransferase subunit GatC [Ligilactobacillus ceti]|uniref:Aspartyl/glutamyl-tRNA(Asn/Gln) amidotransferase subunit C n=1 Tax=Ligilactobacillus ceti DSM 22408 TaxID=1122146 RepID=A0A0R2KM62_9LACO|nr:Asp-tRNA(Asn)/Glu-tRNA(Gln) amidotransferase subunit GatC [Ligilactobacillus ceti]KRN90555.1 aspartyl glutamyl-tRNA(Asn Gln) amidotransferase subunit C [Ligilactobacillus ceti DSM 22408]
MAISAKEVAHVASLAKLAFNENELETFTGQMDEIINMVQELSEVDTTDVPVTTHVTDAHNVLREDIAVKGTDRDLLMRNVPESEDGYIKVPAIIDGSEDA